MWSTRDGSSSSVQTGRYVEIFKLYKVPSRITIHPPGEHHYETHVVIGIVRILKDRLDGSCGHPSSCWSSISCRMLYAMGRGRLGMSATVVTSSVRTVAGTGTGMILCVVLGAETL